MKYNVVEVAALNPDYLGFIFYDKSPRNYDQSIPEISEDIKKVGVFVNENITLLEEKIIENKLDVIQLHGEETPDYIAQIKAKVEIWKVFSVGDTFDFNQLKPFENLVSKFLFDTKGKNKGGNGFVFNWDILQQYSSKKPFILSGGIGLNELQAIKNLIQKYDLPIHAIDVNSKFEDKPGLKNITKLKQFTNEF